VIFQTPADLLCLFYLHAITLGRLHSLPLSIAVTRIVYEYPTEVTRLLCETVMLANGKRKDSGYRGIKSKQISALGMRFENLLKEITKKGHYNEKSFEGMRLVPPAYRKLAFETLDRLIIGGEKHVIPATFLDAPEGVCERQFKVQDEDHAHVVDSRRMHVLTDRECLGLLVDATAGVEPLEKSIFLPLFSLVPDGTPTDTDDLTRGRIPAQMPSERLLQEIADIPKNQSVLRAAWTGGAITFVVDGERLETVSPGARCALVSRHPSFMSMVEIWGKCEGQDVLLASDMFSLIDDNETDDLRMDVTLPEGTRLLIRLLVGGHIHRPMMAFQVIYGDAADTDGDGFTGVGETRIIHTVLVIPITIDRKRPKKKIELPPTRAP
jgi:hypothetical protein